VQSPFDIAMMNGTKCRHATWIDGPHDDVVLIDMRKFRGCPGTNGGVVEKDGTLYLLKLRLNAPQPSQSSPWLMTKKHAYFDNIDVLLS